MRQQFLMKLKLPDILFLKGQISMQEKKTAGPHSCLQSITSGRGWFATLKVLVVDRKRAVIARGSRRPPIANWHDTVFQVSNGSLQKFRYKRTGKPAKEAVTPVISVLPIIIKGLPSKVRKRFVRFRHTVNIFPLRDRRTFSVKSID